MIQNVLLIIILVICVFGACRYIYVQKKKGVKCIGCPQAGCCNHKDVGCDNSYRKENK